MKTAKIRSNSDTKKSNPTQENGKNHHGHQRIKSHCQKGHSKHTSVIQHNVPAVFFSTAGYKGNVYHEFNDGILPLYITSQHLSKRVVFVILDFHDWWLMKYGDIISHLSDYQVVDFGADMRAHCFPEAIVGLRIHNELSLDSSLMEGNKRLVDFRDFLNRAYMPRIQSLIHEEELQKSQQKSSLKIKMKVREVYQLKRPKLVADPTKVSQKGWEHTKKIHLEDQTVRLDLIRFRKQLVGAYDYIIDGMCQD